MVKKISKKAYVKLEYRYVTGHKLNLANPVRYTEKLQYLRLYTYPNNLEVSKCASRDGLREYVKEKGLEDHLINCLGIYEKFDDIDFMKLPNQFVMKCTHGCAMNYIVYDLVSLDKDKLRKQFNRWMKQNYGKKTVEMHYSPIKPQIIIEELLLENNELPVEYKIHVFNGKAKYLYVVTGRNKDIHYNNYLIDWTDFDKAQFNHWTKLDKEIKKPQNFAEAIKIAETLAAPFPFVRVDLYIINGKVYISEMTFTPAKGTLTFKDDESDFIIGKWLSI
ncbi:MAG: hypothetical protein K5906_01565 [Bacilli bacterium]|nr:hypothetical protein [Bacilli bacterium]